jgi:hypothetical protein
MALPGKEVSRRMKRTLWRGERRQRERNKRRRLCEGE